MVAAYSWKHPFFSPLVVFHQSRILLQSLKDRHVEQISLKISDPIFVGKIMYDNFEYISYLSAYHQAMLVYPECPKHFGSEFRWTI